MNHVLLPSFTKKFDKYSRNDQQAIIQTIKNILDFIQTNQSPYGLRVKKLSTKIYEARINIHLRIAYFFDKKKITFFCLGNHDDIKRALKTIKKRSFF